MSWLLIFSPNEFSCSSIVATLESPLMSSEPEGVSHLAWMRPGASSMRQGQALVSKGCPDRVKVKTAHASRVEAQRTGPAGSGGLKSTVNVAVRLVLDPSRCRDRDWKRPPCS
jgi:hypothetical protein